MSLQHAFQVARKRWGGNGSGSTPEKTRDVAGALGGLFHRLGVRRVLDLGCGDVGWILPATRDLELYVGVDICREVIDRNQLVAAGQGWLNVEYRLIRGPDEALPEVDLVLTRDCLAHLPNGLVQAALAQARQAAPLLLATTYPRTGSNIDIARAGDFRPLNLELKPFALPPPDQVLVDSDRKVLGLWRWR